MLGAINISYSNSSPEEKSSKQEVCSETKRPTLIKSLNKSLKWQQNCVPAEEKMTKTRIKIHAEPCGQTILTSGCNNRLLVLFPGLAEMLEMTLKQNEAMSFLFTFLILGE